MYERHSGAACAPLGGAYRRREPERTILYSVVQDHLQPFLAEARAEHPYGHGLPSFIEREFTRYLECGILAHGFARVRCDDCGHDRLVAFSCRGRAICPSCNARRMHDTAAHLVDRVLPFLQGFSIHANVSVGETKRDALERLCRYGARPPIALGRLSSTSTDRIVYRVKHHAPGESGLLVLTPLELLGKLSALIPPPRCHGVRYHGVFAPNAKWRSRVVPYGKQATGALEAAPPVAPTAAVTPRVVATRPRRLDWAALLMRVFKIDVLECDQCGGRMRVLAFLTDPDISKGILAHLGLPFAAPGIKPARAPPILQDVVGLSPEAFDPPSDHDGVDPLPTGDI